MEDNRAEYIFPQLTPVIPLLRQVAMLVQFLIENSVEIFGGDITSLFQRPDKEKSENSEDFLGKAMAPYFLGTSPEMPGHSQQLSNTSYKENYNSRAPRPQETRRGDLFSGYPFLLFPAYVLTMALEGTGTAPQMCIPVWLAFIFSITPLLFPATPGLTGSQFASGFMYHAPFHNSLFLNGTI